MIPSPPDLVSSTRVAGVRAVYRAVFPQTLRSPAFWCFAILYLGAVAIYLPAGGRPGLLVEHLLIFGFFSLLLLVILPLTEGAPVPAWSEGAPANQMLTWQLSALLLFALLFLVYTFLLFLLFVPLWGRQNRVLQMIAFSVPLLFFFALPVVTMRLLGSSWQELGLTYGYRSGLVALISCVLPVMLGATLLVVGHLSALGWLTNIIKSLLQAGFPEEIFFRGLLLTRLLRWLGAPWGLFLSALIFGAFHFAVNLSQGGSLGLALADCILDQLTFGLMLAIICFRTRSILAGTLLHTLTDSLKI